MGLLLIVFTYLIQFPLLTRVVPHIESMFQDFGSKMPAITSWLVGLSHWFRSSIFSLGAFLLLAALVHIGLLFTRQKSTRIAAEVFLGLWCLFVVAEISASFWSVYLMSSVVYGVR